jgi:hypothetical protein
MASPQQIGLQLFIHPLKMTEHVKGIVDPVFDFSRFQISQ